MKHFRLIFLYLLLYGNLFSETKMIHIPSGTYTPFLSDKKAKPNQKIKVPSFYLDQYPVGKFEFIQFLEKNPKWKKGIPSSLFVDETYLSELESNPLNLDSKKRNIPITFVSWFSANAYCEFYGKRLPNSDEWEYVASIPPKNKDKKFIQSAILNWYAEKRPENLPERGKYKNRWEVYDMHGLIWEWVYDFNTNSNTGDSRADKDLERNLFCGSGALQTNDSEDYASYMRFGYRSGLSGKYTAKYLGFRCASSVPVLMINK